jgi:hypothetical protein
MFIYYSSKIKIKLHDDRNGGFTAGYGRTPLCYQAAQLGNTDHLLVLQLQFQMLETLLQPFLQFTYSFYRESTSDSLVIFFAKHSSNTIDQATHNVYNVAQICYAVP